MTESIKETEDKVRCVICKELILNGAQVCKHCNNYQGWCRRNISFSHTILSLLIALISVSALLVSNIQKTTSNPEIRMLLREDPNLKFHFRRSASNSLRRLYIEGYLELEVSPILVNEGYKHVAIASAVTTASISHNETINNVKGFVELDSSQAFLGNGDLKILDLNFPLYTETENKRRYIRYDYPEKPTSKNNKEKRVVEVEFKTMNITFKVVLESGETKFYNIKIKPFSQEIEVTSS